MFWYRAYIKLLIQYIELQKKFIQKQHSAHLNQRMFERAAADRVQLRAVLRTFGKNGVCGETIFTTKESVNRYIENYSIAQPAEWYICDQCTAMRKGKESFHVRGIRNIRSIRGSDQSKNQ